MPLPTVALDTPSNANVPQSFQLAGWAIDRGAATGTGVDAVHAYAYPSDTSGNPTGTPIFLGAAAYGGSRPDVGAAYGSQFTNSAYQLTVTDLAAGYYRLVVLARSTVSGAWQDSQRLIQVSYP